ncbi:glycosyltransferase family 2 protein [Avibacterium paragallinarum]|uniref:Glycosyltransferase n=2 Tax=Avibacterium paragallinarum TaxID=728 RepID=A0ABU7QGD6_AVIPA|nr:glycosyltransferase family 2 protein [Avibacterium paragallinarum]
MIFKFSKINRLFKERQYSLLLAKYSAQFNKSLLGKTIFESGLYSQFLTDPQWKGSVFYAVGLLFYKDYTDFRVYWRSFSKKKKLSASDKRIILKSLYINYLHKAKAFCKFYFPQDKILYYSILSVIDEKLKDNSLLEISLLKKPQNILLASNFLAIDNPLKQQYYFNQLMDAYGLRKIVLINYTKAIFSTNLRCDRVKIEQKNAENFPLVSILMTTFNSQEFVENSLLSLIYQDYPNKEIIVIDDCSSDNTCNIVQKISDKYSFVKLIQLPENVGTFVAKTIGAKFATGEFITCQDSDDWAHPEKLTKQVEPLLKNKNIIVTFSKWFRVTEKGKAYSRMIYPFIRLNPSSALFRRQIVEEKTGLWDWVRTGADSEFNARLKLVFGNKAIFVINKPLTIGAHRENSLMTSIETGYSDHSVLIRQQYWENWNNWHIKQLMLGHSIRMNYKNRKELFSIPKEISVDINKISRVFKKLELFL